MKYIIITPVYNEEKYLPYLLNSIVNQELKPEKFILVNDNSSDKSEEILTDYSHKYPYIEYYNYLDDREHITGPRIVEIFLYGYNKVKNFDFDFIVKLDADLELPYNYFTQIANHFKNNQKIGICGGICTLYKNGKWEKEVIAHNLHVRGALKAYRKDCFFKIGELRPTLGWDALDEFLAFYNGYEIFVDENLLVKHYKITDKRLNRTKAALNSGKAYYVMGLNLLTAFLSAGKRSFFKKPFLITSILAYINFLFYYIFRPKKRAVTKDESRFINHYMLSNFKNKIIRSDK